MNAVNIKEVIDQSRALAQAVSDYMLGTVEAKGPNFHLKAAVMRPSILDAEYELHTRITINGKETLTITKIEINKMIRMDKEARNEYFKEIIQDILSEAFMKKTKREAE